MALAEIAWPAAIQNITSGHFKHRVAPEDNDITGSSSTDSRKRKLNERPYGMVTMFELPLRPVQKAIIEKVGSIRPGVYLSVDQILRSICKKIFGGHVDDKFPLSWKLDAASEALKLCYEGSEQKCIFLETISKVLQNVLGMKTLIDCSEIGKTNKQANNSELSKTIGQFPIDLTGGCNTIFVYCNLVQNEILGDSRTALLRAIPLTERPATGNQQQQQQNYRTFGNLQWRRVVKSSIESISVSLPNETGQLVPFLSRGRTNLTLHFRQRLERQKTAKLNFIIIIIIIFVFNDREKVGTKIITIIIALQNSSIKQPDKVLKATAAAALSNGCTLRLSNSTAASAIYLSRTSATVWLWRHGCVCHANGASGDAVDEKVCFASGQRIWQKSSFFICSRICKNYFW